ncbi:MAG: chromosomal replication initiator protein DnaA, partial [Clostridia bacterium]
NKFAHAAAMAVANAPASTYNPLLIYGGSGLGKTHLLTAISRTIHKKTPDAHVVYVKGDDFTNELIACIQNGTVPAFRSKYRTSDLLLVDDIQFIAGKESTQEEFFHTFNELYQVGKQIVLTSDRLPMEMVQLEERLRTRFEWGLMADIQPPDFETRMAIINLKANRLGLEIPQNLKEIIANNVTANVRQIEGTVKKILAYRDLVDYDITQETVEKAIKDMFLENPGLNPTPDLIIREVSRFYQIDESAIIGKNRAKNTVFPRQVAMFLIRDLTNLSFPDIGKAFGGRDHTTVMHSVNKIEAQIKSQDDFKNQVRDIRSNIVGT